MLFLSQVLVAKIDQIQGPELILQGLVLRPQRQIPFPQMGIPTWIVRVHGSAVYAINNSLYTARSPRIKAPLLPLFS